MFGMSINALQDIPPKFTQNIRGELPQQLQLIGPSSNKWNAELRMRGDKMSIVRGWEEFVDDHSIMIGDFMVFRYEDLNLYVQIFDQTACLKEEAFTAKPRNARTKRVSPKENLGSDQLIVLVQVKPWFGNDLSFLVS